MGAIAPPGLPAEAGAKAGVQAADTTLAANPHLKLILGYPLETPEADVAPFARERFVDANAREAFLEKLVANGAINDYLLRMRRVNGSPVWVEVTARSRPARRGGLLRIEALIRDVSDRKRLEDQSKDIYQQILQSEKMAALGQTISGVAHELNNPLATILSWAERLSEKPLDDTAKRGVTVILGEAERAARIVRNLLTFARKRQSTRAMIDVNAVVEETMALRAYDQMLTLTVTTEFAPNLPKVFADTHQIQQVLLNLLINAEQAMLNASGRGTLIIRTHLNEKGDGVIIQVVDDGPGVPPESQTRIFDPFFTTKDVGKGTGLGLTVAYAIVQEHGGRIRLESRPDAGASFYVELPVSGKARVIGPPKREIPINTAAGASIMVVEDEEALATAVADALRDAGYVVQWAHDGEDAFAKVQARRYDLVICDLRMPKLDGRAFYRSLIEAVPDMRSRVVFVTGDVAGTHAERFLEESGCRWLAKPFRLADLLQVVREVLG